MFKNETQMETAKKLLGHDVNDFEYADHIIVENGETFFQIIHLDGSERLAPITDYVK